jgi:hypothetical protein
MEWSTRIINRCSASQACGSVQRYGAYMAFIEVLMDLKQIGFVVTGP